METHSNKNGRQNLPEAIRRLMVVDSWLMLTLIYLLTPEQWCALVWQMGIAELYEQVLKRVRQVLASYPKSFASKWEKDVASDVLVKLTEGKFLKRYDWTRIHPRPYLLGCAYQYARTVTRSYWRKFGRDEV